MCIPFQSNVAAMPLIQAEEYAAPPKQRDAQVGRILPEERSGLAAGIAERAFERWATVPELSIVMPCLNEAATVAPCVRAALSFLQRHSIHGEVVVADNGSTDGSAELAAQAGARVVTVTAKGYGAALTCGIRAARGRFVIMGDADLSYEFDRLEGFIAELRAGSKLVMGNRFLGGVLPKAMPFLHRYLGNPVLSAIGRTLFRTPVGDFHCGLRGFDRDAILALDLNSPGMEFASEMVVKASLAGLTVSEVPTRLQPDGRGRPSHLRTWRDGWRHLRFLLLMSPRWLLLYPGIAALTLGALAMAVLVGGPVMIGHTGFDIHTLLYSAGGTILGLQLVIFSLVARRIGCAFGLLPDTARFRQFDRLFSLERGVVLGGVLMLIGFALAIRSVMMWVDTGLSAMDPVGTMRVAIPSMAMTLAGAQIAFASFVIAMIEVGPQQAAKPEVPDA